MIDAIFSIRWGPCDLICSRRQYANNCRSPPSVIRGSLGQHKIVRLIIRIHRRHTCKGTGISNGSVCFSKADEGKDNQKSLKVDSHLGPHRNFTQKCDGGTCGPRVSAQSGTRARRHCDSGASAPVRACYDSGVTLNGRAALAFCASCSCSDQDLVTSPMNCSDGGRFGHRRAPGSGPGPAGSTLSLPED